MTNTNYPKAVQPGDGSIALRIPEMGDAAAIHGFANDLPAHDLLYLRRDISQRPVVDAWLESVENGESLSLLAERAGAIVGMSALMLDRKSWSPHVGEIRVLIGETARGKGLGRAMIQETFLQAVDLDLDKIIAQMTLDQAGARSVFQEMGFEQEALLKDHVRDRNGNDHDIIIMSCDVSSVASRLQSYR
ncbi:MAG: GNAT family N-acetyltransferase [Pseudomonadota bacterium]